MRTSYSLLSFSYLIGFSKKKVGNSERDRGLFIQYLARKYAERAREPRGECGGQVALLLCYAPLLNCNLHACRRVGSTRVLGSLFQAKYYRL
jgi:hypothetical protein